MHYTKWQSASLLFRPCLELELIIWKVLFRTIKSILIVLLHNLFQCITCCLVILSKLLKKSEFSVVSSIIKVRPCLSTPILPRLYSKSEIVTPVAEVPPHIIMYVSRNMFSGYLLARIELLS